MSTPLGRRVLQPLMNFTGRDGWFTKQFPKLAELMANTYQSRNEVVIGGVISDGTTISASVMQISSTACELRLKGRMGLLAAQTDLDLFTTSGAAARATFADGATAAAISLATEATAYVSLIAANTDGAGGANEGDNFAPKLIAVVAGTASTYGAQTAFLSSQEIQAALEAATGVHDGVTGWVRIADIFWDEGDGAPAISITMNRNNVILDE